MEVRQNDNSVREKEWYREKIVDIIGNINNVDYLYNIYKMAETYLKIQKGEI